MAIAEQVRLARIAIGENPGRGHHIESDIFPDLRAVRVKKSLICYRVLPMRVVIVRILDVRRDIWTILGRPQSLPPTEPEN